MKTKRKGRIPTVVAWAVFAGALLLLCAISLNGGWPFYTLTGPDGLTADCLQQASAYGITDGRIIGSYQQERSVGFAVAEDGQYTVSLYVRSLYGPRYRLASTFLVSEQKSEVMTALTEQFQVYVVRVETDNALTHASFSLLDVKPRPNFEGRIVRMSITVLACSFAFYQLLRRKKQGRDSV